MYKSQLQTISNNLTASRYKEQTNLRSSFAQNCLCLSECIILNYVFRVSVKTSITRRNSKRNQLLVLLAESTRDLVTGRKIEMYKSITLH